MIEFFRKLFAPTNSSQTAKERLRLVLMTDHLSLAPDMIEAMKRDFIDVIAKYVEVDRDKIEINFEQQDKALAMLANVPILAVNRNGGGGDGGGKKHEEPKAAPAATVATAAAAATSTATLPRRKRRKKSPSAIAPANASPAPAG
jgi:cell division topological specificity factor